MSYETASSLSSRSISCPALPPLHHLDTLQENNDHSNCPGSSKLTIRNFGRAFHHIVFPSRSGAVVRLDRVAEATVEDENAVCNTRPSNPMKRKTRVYPTFRLSTSSTVSHSTASSPTNKSQLSAVLLAGEDEEHEEDDPAFTLWHTERLHRARLAKLTRHLGEEVPAEMVLSPVFLSYRTSHFPVHGGYHRKRRSLDPLSFVQESFVARSEGVLRRSKSLEGRGDTRRTLSVTGATPTMPSKKCIAGGVCIAENTTNVVAIPNQAPPPSTTSETWHSNCPVNIPNSNALHEGVSMDTHSDSLLSHSSRLSVGATSEAFPFSLRASRIASRSGILPRRPVAADASRRVEKLANFFGVGQEEVLAVSQSRGTAQKLRFPSSGATGDLAIGIHAPNSQLEVEVRVSKPARFWNSRARIKRVHPDDVMDELRMMRASS
ncbi:hypothetical protein HD554DRAFT_1373626 [Boletus coccyginus]|nr:hypothetical protein HD554DRAFT_1373626 [Boletus coccyginus]